MKIKTAARIAIIIVLLCTMVFSTWWITTQPVWIMDHYTIDDSVLKNVPQKNRHIIQYVQAHGRSIAPAYTEVVCTEFVINVIDRFEPLSRNEKNAIRIITTGDLYALVSNEAPVIRGVQTALVESNKGTAIATDIQPGDFVQFWDGYFGKQYGHCGIVLEAKPNEKLIIYSSHPLTGGFGIQQYRWPDKTFFVRLK